MLLKEAKTGVQMRETLLGGGGVPICALSPFRQGPSWTRLLRQAASVLWAHRH